jgi:hypothetical protein
MIFWNLIWLATFSGLALADDTAIQMQSGVVRISSSFKPGSKEVGTGVVVSYPVEGKDRTFLLTCAHLSTGKDTQVAGKPLSEIILGRRTDNFRDLDLIEIDPKKLAVQPFAHFQENREANNWLSGVAEGVAQGEGNTPKAVMDRLSGGVFLVNEKSFHAWSQLADRPVMAATPEAEDTPFVLNPSWASLDHEASWPGREKKLGSNFDPEQPNFGGTLVFDPTTRTISAPSRLSPGMSCAPLITYTTVNFDSKARKMELRGLGTEFRAEMSGSTFTSNFIWEDSIRSYLKGDTKEDIPATWQTKNGLQYLKIGNRSAEIIPSQRPAGNGVTVPPGNGTTVPPGKSELKSEIGHCNPSKIEDTWKKYGLKPGILWHGKEVLGFAMDFDAVNSVMPNVKPTPVLIYPDRSGIEFRSNNGKFAKQVEDVPVGSPVLSWLDKRYQMKKPVYQLVAVDKLGRVSTLSRRANGIDIQTYGPDNDPIQIHLNKFGAQSEKRPPENKQLKTLIEVKGKSGAVYLVDLTDVFFLRASAILPRNAVTVSNPANDYPLREDAERFAPNSIYSFAAQKRAVKSLFEPFSESERHVGISVRKKCTNSEIRINFPETYEEIRTDAPCVSEEKMFIHGLENIEELKGRVEGLRFYQGMGHSMPSEN